MNRRLFLTFSLCFAVVGLGGCQTAPPRSVQAQALVDQSKITIDYFKTRSKDSTALFLAALKEARGVIIFPDVFQAGVGIGGQSGNGVMLARTASGDWGYPAFLNIGGASLGVQLGAQSTEYVLLLMTDRAVEAVISSPGQIGLDTQATFGELSAGSVSSTTFKGASVVGFTKGEGVYAGASLSGAGVTAKNDWTEAYYGQFLTVRDVVLDGRATNPGADPLREALQVR
ncbi:MAG: lipid-binding SYLF domain-containing protein [Rhodospirillales bacterium]